MADQAGEKARRRAARAVVGEYHERELTALLEHARDGFARLDAGELDAFELIHYTCLARELWKFCNLGSPEAAASAIAVARERGEEHRSAPVRADRSRSIDR